MSYSLGILGAVFIGISRSCMRFIVAAYQFDELLLRVEGAWGVIGVLWGSEMHPKPQTLNLKTFN